MYSSTATVTGHPTKSLDVHEATSEDEDPSKAALSEGGAAANLLKYVIGLGIISLPEATRHVGWLPSIIGLSLVGFITYGGIFFAVRSRERMDRIEEEAQDVPTQAMTEGHSLIDPRDRPSWKDMPDTGCGFFEKIVGKVWGPSMQYIFSLCIVLGQFTTLVMYLIVITTNFESYFPESHGPAFHALILSLVVFVLGIFSLIPTLQGISYLSAIGLSIYAFLFLALFHEYVLKANAGTLPNDARMVVPPTSQGYGEWFGISCFAFSAFPIAMNIHEDMRNPRSFDRVVIFSMVAVWVVYSAFGVIGYLCYGSDTNVLIYFNFPEGSIWRNGSAGALGCILCFSFIVQAMPIFICTAKAWETSQVGTKIGLPGAPLVAVRWTVLALTVATAYMVPDLQVLMDTVGAISGVLTGFILPAATCMRLSSRHDYVENLVCVLIIIVGVMGAYYSCAAA
jgi:proton-coupled amino acid transporter